MKKFTLANLNKDGASKPGLDFVTPLIKAKKDVAVELKNYPNWFAWAVVNGYDCESARGSDFNWTKEGAIIATAGDRGTATAGDWGTATAGDWGTATARDWGTATAGYKGTATAGDGGIIAILYWNGSQYRRRCVEVDGEKIKANTPYRLNAAGEFEEAPQ